MFELFKAKWRIWWQSLDDFWVFRLYYQMATMLDFADQVHSISSTEPSSFVSVTEWIFRVWKRLMEKSLLLRILFNKFVFCVLFCGPGNRLLNFWLNRWMRKLVLELNQTEQGRQLLAIYIKVNQSIYSNLVSSTTNNSFQPIVQVRLSSLNGDKIISTWAMIDTGSANSFVSPYLAKQLIDSDQEVVQTIIEDRPQMIFAIINVRPKTYYRIGVYVLDKEMPYISWLPDNVFAEQNPPAHSFIELHKQQKAFGEQIHFFIGQDLLSSLVLPANNHDREQKEIFQSNVRIGNLAKVYTQLGWIHNGGYWTRHTNQMFANLMEKIAEHCVAVGFAPPAIRPHTDPLFNCCIKLLDELFQSAYRHHAGVWFVEVKWSDWWEYAFNIVRTKCQLFGWTVWAWFSGTWHQTLESHTEMPTYHESIDVDDDSEDSSVTMLSQPPNPRARQQFQKVEQCLRIDYSAIDCEKSNLQIILQFLAQKPIYRHLNSTPPFRPVVKLGVSGTGTHSFMQTYAYIDTGNCVSYISPWLMTKLHLTPYWVVPQVYTCMDTNISATVFNAVNVTFSSHNLKASDTKTVDCRLFVQFCGETFEPINARQDLPDEMQQIIERKHLNIDYEPITPEPMCHIFIGQDLMRHFVKKNRTNIHVEGMPAAFVQTRFGWHVCGCENDWVGVVVEEDSMNSSD